MASHSKIKHLHSVVDKIITPTLPKKVLLIAWYRHNQGHNRGNNERMDAPFPVAKKTLLEKRLVAGRVIKSSAGQFEQTKLPKGKIKFDEEQVSVALPRFPQLGKGLCNTYDIVLSSKMLSENEQNCEEAMSTFVSNFFLCY